MARTCELCRRGSVKAVNRSHSNIRNLRRQHINLQSKWIDGVRVKLCTTCIKTAKTKGIIESTAQEKTK